MQGVVGYTRVSTDRQAEEGLGLQVQEKSIRTWCRSNGHRLITIKTDEGVSGTVSAEERPGLAAVLSIISDGGATGLVVPRLDRLARTLAVQEAALAHVWRLGGDVYTCDSGLVLRDDPEDPARTAMRQMFGVFAELERAMISARLRAGRRLKGEQGGYAFGAPGLGYVAREGELVADPQEQEILARIAYLRSSGFSIRQICEALTQDGYSPKRGGAWHPGTVGRLVKRIRPPE